MRRIAIRVAAVFLAVVALLYILHLVCLYCGRPLVRLVQVDGNSMEPTFEPGDRLLFIRGRWKESSVVLADVHEDLPVIKRVCKAGLHPSSSPYKLCGDNREISMTYWVNKEQILCVLLCRIPLKLPCCRAR